MDTAPRVATVRGAFELLLALVDHVLAMLGYRGAELRCRFANRDYRRWFGVEPDARMPLPYECSLGSRLRWWSGIVTLPW